MAATTPDEVNSFLSELGDFSSAGVMTVEAIEDETVTVRWNYNESLLRPGGYVSGPVLFTVADLCGWVMTFLDEGITPMAVTWDLHITFLRPAIGGDVIGVGRRIKRGKSLIHGDVLMHIEGQEQKPVAHAKVTYVLPSGD